MAVRKLKPITPGQRHRTAPVFDALSGSSPEKSLLVGKTVKSGKNSQGRTTVRHVGGGHKRKYRIIDFKRDKREIPGVVSSVEYDPNRTAFISLINYKDGEKRYILNPNGLKVGMTINAGEKQPPEIGFALPLEKIPLGTVIHNIEIKPGKGGAMVRSAGSSAQLVAREGKYATIKMPSGEMRLVLSMCYATIGVISNGDHMNTTLGKAGRNRWKGKRPHTRGVAMNPVDHPMGGGEGKASGGQPRSRTGLLSKGLKTRKPNKYSDRFIVSKKK
jgi:large subunit ribosomal protein L2